MRVQCGYCIDTRFVLSVVLYGTVWYWVGYCMVLEVTVWYCMVQCGNVWYYMVWYGTVWYSFVLFRPCCTISAMLYGMYCIVLSALPYIRCTLIVLGVVYCAVCIVLHYMQCTMLPVPYCIASIVLYYMYCIVSSVVLYYS